MTMILLLGGSFEYQLLLHFQHQCKNYSGSTLRITQV